MEKEPSMNPTPASNPDLHKDLGIAWNGLSDAMHLIGLLDAHGPQKEFARLYAYIEQAHGAVQRALPTLAPAPSLKVSPQAPTDAFEIEAEANKVRCEIYKGDAQATAALDRIVSEYRALAARVAVQDIALKVPASEVRFAFAVGFRHGCGANVSDEMDLLRKLSDAWKKESAHLSGNPGQLAQAPTESAFLDPATVMECARLVDLWWKNWLRLQSNPAYYREADRVVDYFPEKLRELIGKAQPIEKLEQLAQAPGLDANWVVRRCDEAFYAPIPRTPEKTAAIQLKIIEMIRSQAMATITETEKLAPQPPPESNRGGDREWELKGFAYVNGGTMVGVNAGPALKLGETITVREVQPPESPTAKPAPSYREPSPAALRLWEEAGKENQDPEAGELGAGDTAEGPTHAPVFDERHDSECNWRVKREMCNCWLKDEEADDNIATDRAAWPGSTDGGKA